jgi:hypothetical protein
MSPGEVLDRWTILRMKTRLEPKLAGELARFEDEAMGLLELAREKGFFPAVLRHALVLMETNSKIWMLEASLRKEYHGDPAAREKLDKDAIVERVFMIRDINRLRVEAKGLADEAFGFQPDVKVDHASAPPLPPAKFSDGDSPEEVVRRLKERSQGGGPARPYPSLEDAAHPYSGQRGKGE